MQSDITTFIKGFSEWSLRIMKCDVSVMNRDWAALYQSVIYGLCSVTSECVFMGCAVLHRSVIYGLCSVTSECYLWTVQSYIRVLIIACAGLHQSVMYGLCSVTSECYLWTVQLTSES